MRRERHQVPQAEETAQAKTWHLGLQFSGAEQERGEVRGRVMGAERGREDRTGEERGGEGGGGYPGRTESPYPAGASRGLQSGIPAHSSWQNTIAFGIQGSEEPCEKQSTPNRLKI